MVENADILKVEILLVEDNPGDVVLFNEALQSSPVPTHLTVVEDGEDALAFLGRQPRFQSSPRPNLIILDLNLPKLNGSEVLQEIRQNSEFDTIPVVILTTSRSDKDVVAAYRMHANSYTVKPVDLPHFMEVLKELTHFWLNIASLPGES